MPAWRQGFASNQSVSVTVDAARGLMLGGADAGDIVASVLWSGNLIAVFAPRAVRRSRAAPSRPSWDYYPDDHSPR
jgi:oleandomycin transport system permease protein